MSFRGTPTGASHACFKQGDAPFSTQERDGPVNKDSMRLGEVIHKDSKKALVGASAKIQL